MESIRETIKKIILFPEYMAICAKMRADKCMILLGTSSYKNLGDHLLSSNSIDFLKRYFSEYKIVEIPLRVFRVFEKEWAKLDTKKAIVFISGGGWMGNLWEEDEYCMQKMLKAFSQSKIFILPQTVYYDRNLKNYKTVLEKANESYKECSDLTLFVRESNSFVTAKQTLGIDKIYLAPDMGFYGNKTIRDDDIRLDALLCFRDDKEALIDRKIESTVCNYLSSMSCSIRYFDTIKRHNIPNYERRRYIKRLRDFLENNARIVFTDRLHGMIFAVISGCKCVAFDNKNHKVSGVYNDWLKTNPNVVLVDDNNPFDISKVSKLFEPAQASNGWCDLIDAEFEHMAEILRYEIKA